MVARDFTPGFRAELHHKDLGILMDASREVGAATPLGSILTQLMAALPAQGVGQLDHTALLRIVDQLSGRNPGPAADAGNNQG
jgi:2-hydroxy-3-oxopropionate reductase